jgi:type IV secretion system protein VirB9
MFKRIAVFLLLGCWSANAFANQPVVGSNDDPRIRHKVYAEQKVYDLDLHLKSVAAIQFGGDEEVESILIGDSASWEVVKLKSGNVVSIKPIIPETATNMTVYTSKRVYSFQLRSIGEFTAGSNETATFRTIFSYPPPPQPKPKPVVRSNKAPSSARRIQQSRYVFAGNSDFRPLWVEDNGRQTVFVLPKGAPRPAIYKLGPNNKEQLVNSRTRGSRIIVDGTSDFWVMRIGNKSICVGTSRQIIEKYLSGRSKK